MKAIWEGQIIAESDVTEIVESNHYFPRSSLKDEYFTQSSKNTVCGWKGTASYLNVVVNEKINQDAAWYYPSPKESAQNIAGMVAFWRGVKVVD